MLSSEIDYCYALEVSPLFSKSKFIKSPSNPITLTTPFQNRIIDIVKHAGEILLPYTEDAIFKDLKRLDRYINDFTHNIILNIEAKQNITHVSPHFIAIQGHSLEKMKMRYDTEYTNTELSLKLLSDNAIRDKLLSDFSLQENEEIFAAIALVNIDLVCQCYNAPFYLEASDEFQMPTNRQELRALVLKTEAYYYDMLISQMVNISDSDNTHQNNKPQAYSFDKLPKFWQFARLEQAGFFLGEAERALTLAAYITALPKTVKLYFSDTGSQGGKAKNESDFEQSRKAVLNLALELALKQDPYDTLTIAATKIARHPDIAELCENTDTLLDVVERQRKIHRHLDIQPKHIKARISHRVAKIAGKNLSTEN